MITYKMREHSTFLLCFYYGLFGPKLRPGLNDYTWPLPNLPSLNNAHFSFKLPKSFGCSKRQPYGALFRNTEIRWVYADQRSSKVCGLRLLYKDLPLTSHRWNHHPPTTLNNHHTTTLMRTDARPPLLIPLAGQAVGSVWRIVLICTEPNVWASKAATQATSRE